MENNTLKPCPFCGRKVKIYEFRSDLFDVTCVCGCESPRDSVSKEGIKRIWNRRRPELLLINANAKLSASAPILRELVEKQDELIRQLNYEHETCNTRIPQLKKEIESLKKQL